jgi:hypothetical protein
MKKATFLPEHSAVVGTSTKVTPVGNDVWFEVRGQANGLDDRQLTGRNYFLRRFDWLRKLPATQVGISTKADHLNGAYVHTRTAVSPISGALSGSQLI